MSDSPAEPTFDLAVVGAGLTGLRLARRAVAAGQRVRIVERAPAPGGSARTQRSEGFACELGAFALASDDWSDHCRTLARPPQGQPLADTARTGSLWNGTELLPAAVDGDPHSGATGLEDLAVAYRRELGDALQLGRTVAGVLPTDAGWTLALDGDPAPTFAARSVALAVPLDVAAALLAPLDPALAAAAPRLRQRPAAFVFVGTWQDEAANDALRGYGVRVEGPIGGEPTAARELLFCSNAFARRAQPGKALVRIELGGPLVAERDDDALAALAEAALRQTTGWRGSLLFRRVHRFAELERDGAYTECRVRLRDLANRAPGLTIA